jgi:hypothetical protein
MRPWTLLVMFVVAASLLARDAGACGMFARAPGLAEAELLASTPYLAVERSLVVWDRETKTEDFVREARFERADQSFGFVVPTPTEPAVSGVKNGPFDRLQKKMPYVSRSGEGRGLGAERARLLRHLLELVDQPDAVLRRHVALGASEVVDHQARAFLREPTHDRRAQPPGATGAGDDRDLALQVRIHG